MSRLLDNLLIFGRVLRRAGMDIHPGRLLDVIEALGHVNLGARDEVYHTGELGDQIARLQRSCHRLVWLNPLIGTADYASLTRGLRAALPFVDDFLPARTLTNLADLAMHLNTLGVLQSG